MTLLTLSSPRSADILLKSLGVVAGLAIGLGLLSFAMPQHGLALISPVGMVLLLAGAGCIWGIRRHAGLRDQIAIERDRNFALANAANAAATAKRDGEVRHSAVLQQLPIGIVQTDLAGRIEMANGHAAQLLGRPIGQLTGNSIAEMVHIADRADLTIFFQGLSDGQPQGNIRLRSTTSGRPALLVHGGLARDTGIDPHSLLLAIERTA